jgi:WD40 repeat protein
MRRRCFLTACLTFVLTQPALAADKDDAPKASSPDGRQLARGDDKSIRVSDAATQKELLTLNGHTGKVTALAYAPDGKFLASGGEDKSVAFWDVATAKQVRKFAVKNPVVSLSFSGDGKTLTVTDNKQTTSKFDVATGKEIGN